MRRGITNEQARCTAVSAIQDTLLSNYSEDGTVDRKDYC